MDALHWYESSYAFSDDSGAWCQSSETFKIISSSLPHRNCTFWAGRCTGLFWISRCAASRYLWLSLAEHTENGKFQKQEIPARIYKPFLSFHPSHCAFLYAQSQSAPLFLPVEFKASLLLKRTNQQTFEMLPLSFNTRRRLHSDPHFLIPAQVVWRNWEKHLH